MEHTNTSASGRDDQSASTWAEPGTLPSNLKATRLSRRTVIAGAATAATAGLTLFSGASGAFGATNPIPKLPYEVSRVSNNVTASGKTYYENILVKIGGDQARIFIPHNAIPKQTTPIGVVWFYHATGSTYSALTSAYKYPAELCLDNGAVSICQNYGGDQYTNPIAQTVMKNGWTYMSSLYNIGLNFLRANSGGGALAAYTYAAKLIPNVRGYYSGSAVYDMEKLYASSPDRVGPVYNNDPAQVALYNPAKFPVDAWKGARVRICAAADSNPDPVVPAIDHGEALIAKISPVAVEASARFYTTGGHDVPSWVNQDMLAAFLRWAS